MIVDLQVNLESKDGALVDALALVERAKAAGLDGLVVTQEGQLSPDVQAFRDAGAEHGVKIFSATKLATNHGLILCIVPAGAGALAEDFAERAEDGIYDAASVIDAVDGLGGATIALRPYDRDVARPMGDHLFSLQGLSACEVQNGRISDIANDLALEAASNMEMPCVGTSCAEGVEGLGTAATLFRAAVSSESELCEAIRAGQCWPVTFSDEAPRPEQPRRDRGGDRRGGGGRRGGRGGRGGGRGGDRGGDRGGERRGGRDRDRDGNRDRDGGRGGRGGRGGGRGRGRGGGGRGRRSGPLPDDIGNRAPQQRRSVDEDIGNRRSEDRELDENIGNRLAPGEVSPYRPRDDDSFGNE